MGKAGSKSRDNQPRKGPAKRTSPGGPATAAGGKKSGHSSPGLITGGLLEFVIDSDLSQQREIQKRILDAVESAGYLPDNLFAVKISLEEALINAIKHGNKLDPKKRVHVQAAVSPEQTQIIVEDEGPGFERKHVPDPTAEENLLKCSGRGLLLMETYMDEVEYSKSGRRIRMVKKNSNRAQG